MEKIENNLLYKRLSNSEFKSKIDEIYIYADNILQKDNKIFANYTDHGIQHSLRVLKYMTDLVNNIDELTELEIVLIISAALLHDVGMVVEDEDIDQLIKSDKNELGLRYSIILQEYNDEKLALQECFRPVHGIRSMRHIVNKMDKKLFCIHGTEQISYAKELGLICESHTQSKDWVRSNLESKNIKGQYVYNAQYIALLLRLGDILDIDELRTPPYIQKLYKLNSVGELEWKQHYSIDNTKKIFFDEKSQQKYITIHGNSDDPIVHRKLLKYIDWINDELSNAVETSRNFQEVKYLLNIQQKVDNNIKTTGFSISDFRLSLDYNAVTELLMGEKIYGNKKYGLRELVQNSIDACKIMSEISKNENSFLDKYTPYITIIIDNDTKKVSIRDNGIGMTIDTLKKYFLNVGLSYYVSKEFRFKGYDYKPIGNYGIGFLACFMLSDKVIVNTGHYSEAKVSKIEIERASEYISLLHKDDVSKHGTEIILNYDSFMSVFYNDIKNIQEFIEENFLIDEIEIKIIKIEGGNPELFNCVSIPTLKDNIINLDAYLNGIDVRLKLKGNNETIHNLQELLEVDAEDIWVYDRENNQLIEGAERSALDFIRGDEISYLMVPLIDGYTADRFESLISALDDWDEAYEKIENDINRNIFIFFEDFEDVLYQIGKVGVNEQIIEDFCYEDYCDFFEIESETGTKVELIEKIVSHDELVKSIMTVNNKVTVGKQNYYYQYTLFDNKKYEQKIYNKNVYLSNTVIEVPYLAEILNIGNAVINIKHKNIVPNLSRDNITEQVYLDKIGYAIGRAIHKYYYENTQLSTELRILLKVFIDEYYSKDNEFTK